MNDLPQRKGHCTTQRALIIFIASSAARRPDILADDVEEPQTTTPTNKVINKTSNILVTFNSHWLNTLYLPLFCTRKVSGKRQS
ncbi:hypothetical protein [Yoonia vestfoldensis]|uniref:hypothetical protein n=1 Tax=Yoonia vestfoldensis TaxID=245188 RepID=UPI001B7FAE2F|nr:hypothetical protein [Yoonia vestfoldensis]